jgi:16S rRNA (guanine527-N7)-methyltransferase
MRSRKTSDAANIGREISELETGLNELGISLESDKLDKFKTYLKVLYSYHGKIHLLSHADYERISRRHFLTSLVAFPFVRENKRCGDIGAGAGFPSVPLKILLPEMELVIFESVQKKAAFLQHLIEELELTKVQVINDRAEQYSGTGFDLVLLRAVGKIQGLIEVIDTLLAAGGSSIFFKTHRVDHEIAAVKVELERRGFTLQVKKIYTPVEKLPVSLVILAKSQH